MKLQLHLLLGVPSTRNLFGLLILIHKHLLHESRENGLRAMPNGFGYVNLVQQGLLICFQELSSGIHVLVELVIHLLRAVGLELATLCARAEPAQPLFDGGPTHDLPIA